MVLLTVSAVCLCACVYMCTCPVFCTLTVLGYGSDPPLTSPSPPASSGSCCMETSCYHCRRAGLHPHPCPFCLRIVSLSQNLEIISKYPILDDSISTGNNTNNTLLSSLKEKCAFDWTILDSIPREAEVWVCKIKK